MRRLSCLRCDGPMRFLTQEKFQMGEHGFLTGDLSHLIHGALELEVYICPQCGKMEFFAPEKSESHSLEDLPQKQCPRCGKRHDFDYPKCPYCDFDYYAK